MRVLIVSGIWPPDVGGPAAHAPELGRFLVERGHSVFGATTRLPSVPPEDVGFPVAAARRDLPTPARLAAAAGVVRARRARSTSSTRPGCRIVRLWLRRCDGARWS